MISCSCSLLVSKEFLLTRTICEMLSSIHWWTWSYSLVTSTFHCYQLNLTKTVDASLYRVLLDFHSFEKLIKEKKPQSRWKQGCVVHGLFQGCRYQVLFTAFDNREPKKEHVESSWVTPCSRNTVHHSPLSILSPSLWQRALKVCWIKVDWTICTTCFLCCGMNQTPLYWLKHNEHRESTAMNNKWDYSLLIRRSDTAENQISRSPLSLAWRSVWGCCSQPPRWHLGSGLKSALKSRKHLHQHLRGSVINIMSVT